MAKDVKTADFTEEQQQKIDQTVESTNLPRALIEEGVAKQGTPVKGKVVDAEDDPVGRAEIATNEIGDPAPQKRVVASTPEEQTKKALKGRKQEPLTEG